MTASSPPPCAKSLTHPAAACARGAGFDHIGIVVKPSPTQLFLLEWGGGLFVCPLEERLTEYYQDDGRLITLRQLHLADSTDRNLIENTIEDFVDMLLRKGLGLNQTIPFDQVLQAVKKQNTAKDHGKVVVDDLNQLFCSKTVTMGVWIFTLPISPLHLPYISPTSPLYLP